MSRLFMNFVTISCSKNVVSSSMSKSRQPIVTVVSSSLRNFSSEKSNPQNSKIKLIPYKPENNKTPTKKDNPNQDIGGSLNYKQIQNKLKQDPKETYLNIFGPGVKMTTKDQIRWPGGLVVNVNEESTKRGLWYDFKNNVGGGPIQAIMYSRNVNFDEAKSIAQKMSEGINEEIDYEDSESTKILKEKEVLKKSKTIEVVRNIWNLSVPLKNTLGEKYLVHIRKIPKDKISHLELRFIPANTKYMNWSTKKQTFTEAIFKLPAILAPIENKNKELVGIQRIYLDPETGQKPSFMKKSKFSLGELKGNVAVIYRGRCKQTADECKQTTNTEKPQKVIIAEGPETAASLIDVLDDDKNIPVLASLSLGNFATLGDILAHMLNGKQTADFRSKPTVIIAADNDGDDNEESKTIKKLQKSLKPHGIDLEIKRPKLLPSSDKTDWNDILLHNGYDNMKKIFMKS